MRKFIGWDCAHRTLAWSYVQINTNIYAELGQLADDLLALLVDSSGASHTPQQVCDSTRSAMQRPDFIPAVMPVLRAMLAVTGGFLTYISSGVEDILCGKKIAETPYVARTAALWKFLTTHPDIARVDATPIIEHQPPKIGSKTTDKSAAISHQLAFYYIEQGPVMINPKLKNNIALGPTLSLTCFLEPALKKYKTPSAARYTARKQHSKANFLRLLDAFDLQHIADDVQAAVLDDLADSTMQILAHVVVEKLFYR